MRYTPIKQYENVPTGFDPAKCLYCGAPQEVIDHCPPVTLQYHYQPSGLPFWLVPSCKECNYALGSKDLPTVSKRVEYLYHHYLLRLNHDTPQHYRLDWISRARDLLELRNGDKEAPSGKDILYQPLPNEIPQQASEEKRPRTDRQSKGLGSKNGKNTFWEEKVIALEKEIFELRKQLKELQQ